MNLIYNIRHQFLKNCLFIAILLSGAGTTLASDASYFFDQISLKEGLTQSTVKTVYRDHIGLLWIGTKDGLNRYDGSNVRSYLHDTKDENSLPNTNIHFIIEDKNKTLWIGTAGALCRYDREKDQFVKELFEGKELSFQNALAVSHWLYFATPNALYRYDSKSNEWSYKPYSGAQKSILLGCSLERWGKDQILIASRWSGLFICNPTTGKLSKSNFFDGKLILDTYTDSKNRLWISQNGAGVFCYNANGQKLHEITARTTKFPCDKVMGITEYKNEIWMATDGDGIVTFKPATNEFELLSHNQNIPFSLPVNSFLTIYTDNFANLWLGTIRGGLIGVRNVSIRSYVNAALNSSYGLSEKTVLSFYEDVNGLIWIGTDGEGINSYDPKTQRFSHYRATFGKKVSSITYYSQQELLLSFYKEGLALFNKNSGQLRPFKFNYSTNNTANWSGLLGINVQNAGNNNLYLSEEKLYKYSINTNQLSLITFPSFQEGAIRINPTTPESQELIFYSAKVIRSINTQTDEIKVLAKITDVDKGYINGLDVDKDGKVWVGTSTGLFVLEKNGGLKQLCANQLKAVSTVVSDFKGYLWVGVGLDLYRYQKKTGELIKYGKAEGVSANEYLPKSKLRSASGDIYMGGVEGFIRVNHTISEMKDFRPKFELLNIQVNGAVLPTTRKENSANVATITIPYDHNSLLVNYFINTPDLGESKHCRYTLKGQNKVYVDAPRQSINLQTLAPGEYTLQLSYELKNNIWSANFDLVHIHVSPPWWNTWWFYSLLFLLVIGALIVFKDITERNAKRSMEMEMQLKEKDLYEQKLKFLINISHELRTPLTLVYSPLRRLLKDGNAKTDDLRNTLLMMFKHVNNIRNIINMVLDVRKMDVTHDSVHLKAFDVHAWLKEIADDFSLELDARNISLVYDFDEKVTELYFDGEKCEKVLSNLLMNALKFSHPDTTITIKTEAIDDVVRFSIADQGIGVKPDEATQLFTRFYQGDHNKGGSGIGLSFSKTLVEMHGGQIGYKPGENKQGSVFWFTIPLNAHKVHVEYMEPAVPAVDEIELSAEVDPALVDDLQQITLLLVEDEKELLNYLKESLSAYFKKIITATDGEKGYTQIINYSPDIIISDVMMPKMNGFELCKKVKTNLEISHTPVILLTALGNDENVLTGYKHGADMYLAKPFDVEQLVAIITNLYKSRNDIKNRYKELNSQLLPEQITFSNADEQFLAKLIEKIELKLEDSEIDINWLAQEMAMGRTSFYNKVKAITGMSANVFIIDFKIKKAINLLAHSSLPVLEIALMLGFSNQRYFSTVFKQHTGKTPTQYRNELNN